MYEVDFREVGLEVGWVVVDPEGRTLECYGPYQTEGQAQKRANWLNYRKGKVLHWDMV